MRGKIECCEKKINICKEKILYDTIGMSYDNLK